MPSFKRTTASLALLLALTPSAFSQNAPQPENSNAAPAQDSPTNSNAAPQGGPGGPGGLGGGPGGGFGGFGNRGPRGGGSSNEADLMKIEGDKVSLQFPNNSINDILGIYERLTNRTLIKDTAIFTNGAPISLVTPQPVSKEEAIRLIEGSLLTNGYAVVSDPKNNAAVILSTASQNTAGAQFSRNVNFYQSANDLPEEDTIVSYFMGLQYLDPTDAVQILGNHVGLNVYGRITPVTNPPGLLIFDSANIVRQLVNIKGVIDVPSSASSLVTKFIPLKYADAATVAQIVQATLEAQATESEEKGITTLRGQAPNQGNQNQNQNNQRQQNNPGNNNPNQNNNGANQRVRVTSQVVADPRLNQLLIVAEPEDYTYITSLVQEFDKPVHVPEAYERKLKNVYSVDVISVLADLLKENSSAVQLPGGGTLNQAQQQLTSSNNQLLTGRNNNNARGGSFSNSGTGDTSVASRPDQLIEPEEDNSPVAVLINKTRIIADPLANSIIVIGPKEDQDKVDMLLEKLDRKPPQVYLSTIIGQLTLGDEYNVGVNYLQKFTKTGDNSGMTSGLITRNDIVSNNNVSDMTNNLITSAISNAYGFNLYGQIGDNLDVFINALETNNNFKVLSRPSVFALNNKKAVITSGQSIPVPSQTLTNASSSNVNNNGNVTTSIDYKDVVLKLEVIPLINPDGNVTLKVAQVNDTVIGNQVVAQNDVPIIGTEQITTTVTVASGNTIVIGGLITEHNQKIRTGVPVLSRIPGLGRAFREDNDKVERKELIIFIQPEVVDSDFQIRRASYQEDLRTSVGADAARAFPSNAALTPDKNEVTPIQPETKKKRVLGIFKRRGE